MIRLPTIEDVVNQKNLEEVLHVLFPKEKIVTNVRKEALIRSPETEKLLELDVWLPNLNVAFEFQDPYHYTTTWDSQIPLQAVQKKDIIKQQLANAAGVTLVVVPFWWDGLKESLRATLLFYRPDLCTELLPIAKSSLSLEIQLNPLLEHFKAAVVPNVGELMLASFPLDPRFRSSLSEDNSWWMGEKYDGVRVCWNSTREKLYSRAGNIIEIPDNFLPGFFYNLFLDGELWFGRGFFTHALSSLSAEEATHWSFARVNAFDSPSPALRNLPFENRYCSLLNGTNNTADQHPFIIVAHRVLCISKRHLNSTLKQIISDGGEGVILRVPTSPYFSGRSKLLVKLKGSRGDREAMVEFVGPDKSVLLKLPDGTSFKAPPPEELKLTKGDIVTFSHDRFSKTSLPVNPVIERIRSDLSWEYMVRNYWENSHFLHESKSTPVPVRSEQLGLLGTKKGKRMRRFFEEFARTKGFDPLVTENWYKVNRTSIEETKHGTEILAQCGGFTKALTSLFPELHIDVRRFKKHSPDYWKDLKNRRKFFENFAANKNFDALVPSNWLSVTKEEIMSSKGGETVLQYYSKSVSKALFHLFPDIGLVKDHFESPKGKVQTTESRRLTFVNYATNKGFDPLIAENWYSITGDTITSENKDARAVVQHYGGSFINALVQLFPKMVFDKSKFAMMSRNYWQDAANRRQFFLQFAQNNHFDPLNPENWYKIERSDLFSVKGAATLLQHYSGCYITALLDVFPDINLLSSRFQSSQKNYWDSVKNRRKVFLDLATTESFDPNIPDNWYKHTKESLSAFKGVKEALEYYKGSLTKALLDLFPNIGLEPSLFGISKWKEKENRKQWFVEFASRSGFDPLVLSNWNSLPLPQILSAKDASAVLRYYGGNHKKAAKELFS
eukprot:Phypoly_transcript_01895.p1 GENE.Phypoly_transcript_01895~~Phypoly_transcript_01895.p1  ORF type:complete len:897 (+),score=113.58 Phypoly_transcript_01895:334-3024(+)